MTESTSILLQDTPPFQEVRGVQKDVVIPPEDATIPSTSSSSSYSSSSSTIGSLAQAEDLTKTSSSRNSNNNRKSKQNHEAELRALLLQELAKQLQYYFSPANLDTDTYLRTLQTLNDGCVPVRILCNFAKVKALLWATPAWTTRYLQEDARMEMVMKAVRICGSILRLEQIDAATGKIVDLEKPPVTIWAVRPIAEHDLPEPAAETPFTYNTILLRNVQAIVTEEEVHQLLVQHVEDCPPLLRLHRDVANCWYVQMLHQLYVCF
jgi:hypothetical protein